jgi:hypothetical protein
MYNAITNYENTFYLNGMALSGITSVDGSYNIDYKPVNVMGKGFVKQVINSIPTAQLSINRYLVNNDPVFSLTGDGDNYTAQYCNGGLYYKGKYFSFDQGYLNSFSISCSVGEVPQIDSQFNIYGNIGPVSDPTGNINAGSVFVPQVKNINLTCRNSTTNRIKDFSIDFNCPKTPIYGLASSNAQFPLEVHNVFPIEVTTSFTLEIDNYETKELFDDLSSSPITNFNISVSGTILENIPLQTYDGLTLTTYDDIELDAFTKVQKTTPIFNFSNSNAIILSEQINSSADDLMSVTLSYKTYLN